MSSDPAAPPVSHAPCRLSWRWIASLALAFAVVSSVGLQAQSASYRVVFQATWTAATHPVEHPPGAHFSPLIGTAHDSAVSFWGQGELASPGIERMAEQGRSDPFRSEVEAAVSAGHAQGFLQAAGFRSPGSTVLEISVDASQPLITLVSMVAPSPDWFVGVDSLSLREGDEWVYQKVVPLHAWDAGTDSGSSFQSPNRDTRPPKPIALIMGGSLGNGIPLGTLTFTRTDLPPADPLALGQGRFEVQVTWGKPGGERGVATGEALTADTGVFWFFGPDNVELVVKVLDACQGAGRYWFFAGGLTDLEVEIKVRDTENGATRTYRSPLGTAFSPLQDTNAFASCP